MMRFDSSGVSSKTEWPKPGSTMSSEARSLRFSLIAEMRLIRPHCILLRGEFLRGALEIPVCEELDVKDAESVISGFRVLGNRWLSGQSCVGLSVLRSERSECVDGTRALRRPHSVLTKTTPP